MSVMVTEVYEALKEAGVSESKAIKAAEAIQQMSKEDPCTWYKNSFTSINCLLMVNLNNCVG